MPAYFVAEVEITNQAGFEPYRAAVGATIVQYGGRFLTRGGATELIEGGPEPKRIVILEFADKEAVKRWYNSPEYQKILPMRLDNSTGRAFIVEGVKLTSPIREGAGEQTTAAPGLRAREAPNSLITAASLP